MKTIFLYRKNNITQRNPLRFCVLAVIAVLSIPLSANGQTKKLKEFPVSGITKVSIDRLGNFYLLTDKMIRKYDTDGNFMVQFMAPDSVTITLLEPWNPLLLFIYSRPRQEVLHLDRFLAPMDNLVLDPSLAFEPSLASPSPNNSFWILDRADNSLKKVDPKATHVTMEINLKSSTTQKADYTFLREYQNQLFLIDKNTGIQIFSVVGKAIRQFPIPHLNFLGFMGEEIYYLDNGKIKFYDLYTEDQHDLAVDPAALFVLVTDERMVLVKKDKVEVWDYKP